VYADDLAKLRTDRVVFARNTAPTVYAWDLPANVNAVHTANIKNTTYTSPFKNAYNNADVNYVPQALNLTYVRNFNSDQTPVAFKIGPFFPGQSFPLLPTASEVANTFKWELPGYEFIGWSETVDGAVITQPMKLPGTAVVLYAQWRKIKAPDNTNISGDTKNPGDSQDFADTGTTDGGETSAAATHADAATKTGDTLPVGWFLAATLLSFLSSVRLVAIRRKL
jgi:hypothetical protein